MSNPLAVVGAVALMLFGALALGAGMMWLDVWLMERRMGSAKQRDEEVW